MSDEVVEPTVFYGPTDWRPLLEAPLPDVPLRGTSVRCSAVKSSGEPCGNLAVGGTIFCRSHGGNVVSVQEQARRRLDAVRSQLFDTLVDAAQRAVEVYVSVMENERAKDADRLRAADSVLKLLGFDESVSQVPGGDTPQITPLDEELAKLFRTATADRLSRVIDAPSEEVSAEPRADDVQHAAS